MSAPTTPAKMPIARVLLTIDVARSLARRIDAYARAKRLSVNDAVSDLIGAGLTARDAQQRASAARWRHVSTDERREAMRALVGKRRDRRQE